MSENPARAFDELGYVRTVIVGAGQAGLAVAHALIETGQVPQRDFIVLDAAEPDQLSWRRRWHSLTLFTPAWYSALPGLPFSGDQDRHPRGDEVAEYLDAYRAEFGIEPYWGIVALTVGEQPHGHGLTLTTNRGEIRAKNVVAATGPFAHPVLPDIAARVNVPGANLHSDRYTHPKQIPPGSVLVVGAGNTGLQIARELSASHDVVLAVGSKQPLLPQTFLGKDIFFWLTKSGVVGLPPAGPLGRRLASREVIIGDSVESVEATGVQVRPRAVGASGPRIAFSDASEMRPTSVIWATGYTPGTSWLPAAARAGTAVKQTHGATTVRGLYVLGMPWQSSRGSALIGGVGKDARRIARQIGEQV